MPSRDFNFETSNPFEIKKAKSKKGVKFNIPDSSISEKNDKAVVTQSGKCPKRCKDLDHHYYWCFWATSGIYFSCAGKNIAATAALLFNVWIARGGPYSVDVSSSEMLWVWNGGGIKTTTARPAELH